MIMFNYHKLSFSVQTSSIMPLFDALVSTTLIASGTFWFSLVVLHQYPPLGNYLVKLFGFDK